MNFVLDQQVYLEPWILSWLIIQTLCEWILPLYRTIFCDSCINILLLFFTAFLHSNFNISFLDWHTEIVVPVMDESRRGGWDLWILLSVYGGNKAGENLISRHRHSFTARSKNMDLFDMLVPHYWLRRFWETVAARTSNSGALRLLYTLSGERPDKELSFLRMCVWPRRKWHPTRQHTFYVHTN